MVSFIDSTAATRLQEINWNALMGNMGSDEDIDALAQQVSFGMILDRQQADAVTPTNNSVPQIGESLHVKEEKQGIKLLAEMFQKGKVKNILVLSGAGVSVSAGKVPFHFRSIIMFFLPP